MAQHSLYLLVLARKLLDLVLALGGVYRLGDTAGGAGVRLDREEARCKPGELPPAEVGYIAPLLEAVTSSLAVAGLSPAQMIHLYSLCTPCQLLSVLSGYKALPAGST